MLDHGGRDGCFGALTAIAIYPLVFALACFVWFGGRQRCDLSSLLPHFLYNERKKWRWVAGVVASKQGLEGGMIGVNEGIII